MIVLLNNMKQKSSVIVKKDYLLRRNVTSMSHLTLTRRVVLGLEKIYEMIG